MPVSTDTRPPGVNYAFRPGNAAELTIVFPGGSLTGRTFTSSLNGTTLSSGNGSLTMLGDTMTIVASAALTTTLGTGSFPWLLTETTGGGSEKLLIGTWTGSNRPNVNGTQTIDVLDGDVTLNVTGGPAAFSPDLVMDTPTFPGDGTVEGGVIRRTQSIQIPWSYTQTTDPTDPAIGTAVLVDTDVILSDGSAFGPNFQTGLFGPRGVFQFEGLIRYGKNLSGLVLPAVGYGDFPTFANTAGVARVLSGSWGFLSARSYLADAATVTLTTTDVNQGGAAFVDSAVYATVDGGTLDGVSGNWEHVSYYSLVGIGGNSSLTRRIGLDVRGVFEGMHPAIPEPTGPHWSGAGDWDPTTPSLAEEIGLRVQGFNLGASKIGAQIFSTAMTNLSTSPVIGMQIGLGIGGASTAITLNDTGGGFRTGNNVIGIQMQPTVVYDQDGGAITAFSGWSSAPILKNATGEARTIPLAQSIAARHVYRGDGALLTVNSHVGFQDIVAADVISAGTVTVASAIGFDSQATPGASATYTTRKGFNVLDGAGAGSIGTQIGLDIAALAKGTTNIGIRNAATTVATPLVQTLTAVGNTITPNATVKRLNNTSGGSLTLTSNPHISDGQDGQLLILFNSSANDVVLTDGNGVQLGAATRTLGTNDTLTLIYSTTIGDWIELAFTNN